MKNRPVEPMEQCLDSNDFAVGNFKPHGHSEVRTEGRIVRVETVGPFNVEAVTAINRTRSQLFAANPPNSAYAYINRFKVSALMSSEALAEYEEGLRYAYTGRFKPPSAMAWVFPESLEGRSIMKTHYEKIFSSIGIPFMIFADNDSAESWVQQLLSADDRTTPESGER